MTIPDIILAVVLITLWNGYLIYKMRSYDKEEKTPKRGREVPRDANDRSSKPQHLR